MSGPKGGDLDALPGQLAELRELVREAHGATKDLNRAIKEARAFADGLVQLVDAAADAARNAAHAAGVEQMREFEAHIQAEMNRNAANLNRSIQEARGHIARALRPKVVALDPESATMAIQFEGNLFADDIPVNPP